jgi:hypothetical protein
MIVGALELARPRLWFRCLKESALFNVASLRFTLLPCIEIEIAGATVRLRGSIDVAQLRLVFHCLRWTA